MGLASDNRSPESNEGRMQTCQLGGLGRATEGTDERAEVGKLERLVDAGRA